MRLCLVSSLLLILIGGGALRAQTEGWQTIAPVGHSFTILMPTPATYSTRQVSTSDSDSVPIMTFQSVSKGKRYLVSGFYKSAGNVPLLSSFESFVNGIEYSFKKSAGPDSLKFERDVTMEKATGKQYRLRLGNYAGIARLLNSSAEYYVLVAIGGDGADSDIARFIGSFRTGDVNTNDESSGVKGRGGAVTMVGSSSTPDRNPQQPPNANTSQRAADDDNEFPPNPWPSSNGKISGGVLNGRAIRLVQPEYPKSARKSHDSGQVRVQVVINEVGRVIKAEALGGTEPLKEAAVNAALRCQFTPTLLVGQPVKVSGVIVYNFIAQ